MLKQSGLHPYRLHSACERIPGCVGHCFGQICTRRCRNDAGRICVAPALENHGAHILPNCHVISLDAAGRTVQSAVCLWNGRRVAIRARIFVLALNAMLTPALLLRSANAAFPDGLGNSSGAVGRYLMYHVSDTIAVHFDWPRGFINGLLNHGLSLNDLYVHGGMKLGNIHAHAIVNSALRDATHSPDAAGTAVFHTIVEDFPSADNRVTLARDSDDGVHWHYDVSDELRMRSELLVNAFADALRPKGRVKKLEPSCILNMGHVCGTCRFGTDPHTSVLAADNRIHDLDNAYVVDASFFPSSGGMNPSLTIVANSLRVSALIARR
jgi:choline dehydrogenase-like flavoprotein